MEHLKEGDTDAKVLVLHSGMQNQPGQGSNVPTGFNYQYPPHTQQNHPSNYAATNGGNSLMNQNQFYGMEQQAPSMIAPLQIPVMQSSQNQYSSQGQTANQFISHQNHMGNMNAGFNGYSHQINQNFTNVPGNFHNQNTLTQQNFLPPKIITPHIGQESNGMSFQYNASNSMNVNIPNQNNNMTHSTISPMNSNGAFYGQHQQTQIPHHSPQSITGNFNQNLTVHNTNNTIPSVQEPDDEFGGFESAENPVGDHVGTISSTVELKQHGKDNIQSMDDDDFSEFESAPTSNIASDFKIEDNTLQSNYKEKDSFIDEDDFGSFEVAQTSPPIINVMPGDAFSSRDHQESQLQEGGVNNHSGFNTSTSDGKSAEEKFAIHLTDVIQKSPEKRPEDKLTKSILDELSGVKPESKTISLYEMERRKRNESRETEKSNQSIPLTPSPPHGMKEKVPLSPFLNNENLMMGQAINNPSSTNTLSSFNGVSVDVNAKAKDFSAFDEIVADDEWDEFQDAPTDNQTAINNGEFKPSFNVPFGEEITEGNRRSKSSYNPFDSPLHTNDDFTFEMPNSEAIKGEIFEKEKELNYSLNKEDFIESNMANTAKSSFPTLEEKKTAFFNPFDAFNVISPPSISNENVSENINFHPTSLSDEGIVQGGFGIDKTSDLKQLEKEEGIDESDEEWDDFQDAPIEMQSTPQLLKIEDQNFLAKDQWANNLFSENELEISNEIKNVNLISSIDIKKISDTYTPWTEGEEIVLSPLKHLRTHSFSPKSAKKNNEEDPFSAFDNPNLKGSNLGESNLSADLFFEEKSLDSSRGGNYGNAMDSSVMKELGIYRSSDVAGRRKRSDSTNNEDDEDYTKSILLQTPRTFGGNESEDRNAEGISKLKIDLSNKTDNGKSNSNRKKRNTPSPQHIKIKELPKPEPSLLDFDDSRNDVDSHKSHNQITSGSFGEGVVTRDRLPSNDSIDPFAEATIISEKVLKKEKEGDSFRKSRNISDDDWGDFENGDIQTGNLSSRMSNIISFSTDHNSNKNNFNGGINSTSEMSARPFDVDFEEYNGFENAPNNLANKSEFTYDPFKTFSEEGQYVDNENLSFLELDALQIKSTETLFDPSPFYESTDSKNESQSNVNLQEKTSPENNTSNDNDEIRFDSFEIDKQQMEDIVNLVPPLLNAESGEGKESNVFSGIENDSINYDQPSLEVTLTFLLAVGAYEDAFACWKCLSIKYSIDRLLKQKNQLVEEDKLEEAIQVRSQIKLLYDDLSLYIEGVESINDKNIEIEIKGMIMRWVELSKLLGSKIVKKVCENLTKEENDTDLNKISTNEELPTAVGSANKNIQKKFFLYNSCNNIPLLCQYLRSQIEADNSDSDFDSTKEGQIVKVFEKTTKSSFVSCNILEVRERLLNQSKDLAFYYRNNDDLAMKKIEDDMNSLIACFRSRIRIFHLSYLQLRLFPNMSFHIETLLRKLNLVIHESMCHLKHLHHLGSNNFKKQATRLQKHEKMEEAAFAIEVLATTEFQQFLFGQANIIKVANMILATALDSSLNNLYTEKRDDINNIISSITDSIDQYIRIMQYFDNLFKVTGLTPTNPKLLADLLNVKTASYVSEKAAEAVSKYLFGFVGGSDALRTPSTAIKQENILDLLMKGKDLCNITLLPLTLGKSSKQIKETNEKDKSESTVDELTYVYKSGTPYFTPVLNFWTHHFLPSVDDGALDKKNEDEKVNSIKSEQKGFFGTKSGQSKDRIVSSTKQKNARVIIQLPKAEFVVD